MQIEPDLKYCPRCNDEYRAEIVKCAACGIELETGTERLARQAGGAARRDRRRGVLTAGGDVVIIHSAPLADIRRIEALLAAERISTLVTGEERSCSKSCCPSTFYLHTHRDDARDALLIIAAEHRRLTALDHHDHGCADAVFDPSAVQAVCPACGFSFSTAQTTCPDCGLCFG